MDAGATALSRKARQAMAEGDWASVGRCAAELRRRKPAEAEGAFLMGMAQKAARRIPDAARSFEQALELDSGRHDAAIELAALYVPMNRQTDALDLLEKYRSRLARSSLYLDMAGSTYAAMSLFEDAHELHRQANEVQPGVPSILANLAKCAVYIGRMKEARKIWRDLIRRFPNDQRAHYELSQIETAGDESHIDTMQSLLEKGDRNPAKNIFLYYALGKEYEDLSQWDNAFRFYEKGGAAVKSVSDYDVTEDVELIDTIIETCTPAWFANAPNATGTEKTPIFVVGLPRTGTTLTDRVLSSHSMVMSAGESQLLQMVLRAGRRASNVIGITPAMIREAARRDPAEIARAYVSAIEYRLGDEPLFIEKLPENVLYLGFIARAWPDARIVHLRRHPMDACFAMFKQSYFRYAYSLDDLARYYLAYDRLSRHWRAVLGPRLVELEYEGLVTDFDDEVSRLLERLELPFEEACLDFAGNQSAVATASSAQVRERVHSRSVGKWRHFEEQLAPLRHALEEGGVDLQD